MNTWQFIHPHKHKRTPHNRHTESTVGANLACDRKVTAQNLLTLINWLVQCQNTVCGNETCQVHQQYFSCLGWSFCTSFSFFPRWCKTFRKCWVSDAGRQTQTLKWKPWSGRYEMLWADGWHRRWKLCQTWGVVSAVSASAAVWYLLQPGGRLIVCYFRDQSRWRIFLPHSHRGQNAYQCVLLDISSQVFCQSRSTLLGKWTVHDVCAHFKTWSKQTKTMSRNHFYHSIRVWVFSFQYFPIHRSSGCLSINAQWPGR